MTGRVSGATARQRSSSWPWTRRRGVVRAWSRARLVEGLDPGIAPLAAALLLGQREGVDPDVNDAFARTGTTHLLAISGLHLQALGVVLLFVFRALGLGRRGAFAAVALATIAYALLVGLVPVGGPVGGDDARRLHRRHDRSLGPAGEHPGAGRAGDAGAEPGAPVRRRLSALLPRDRGDRLGERPGVCAGGPTRRTPLDRLERKFEPRWRRRLRGGWPLAGADGCDLAGRLAGHPAAGDPAVPPGLADRHRAEHPPDPADHGSAAGVGSDAGPLGASGRRWGRRRRG